MRRKKTAVKYIALTLLGVVLYKCGAAIALSERGYFAIGGEVFMLFLPLFCWVFSRLMRDAIKPKREGGESSEC